MSVKQSIKVTNAGLSPILSVAQGTGAIEYEFTVSDFDIPSGSAAVAYNIQPTGNIVSQTCSISGNTITIKPPAYYFLRGKNYMQFQVSRSNEDLFSFLIEVWCAPNISQPEVIVAENPSLVSQLISDVGVLSSQLDNLLSIPSGSLSTSADAALADIKVGWDGTTYDTPGDAVRGQIGSLSEDIKNIKKVNVFDKSDITTGGFLRGTVGSDINSIVTREGSFYCNQIWDVKEGDIIRTSTPYMGVSIYDENNELILKFNDELTEYKLPAGSKKMRYSSTVTSANYLDNAMITINFEMPSEYIPYGLNSFPTYEDKQIVENVNSELSKIDNRLINLENKKTAIILRFDGTGGIDFITDPRYSLVCEEFGYNCTISVGFSGGSMVTSAEQFQKLMKYGIDFGIYSNNNPPSLSVISGEDQESISACETYVSEATEAAKTIGAYCPVTWLCRQSNSGYALEKALKKYGYMLASGIYYGDENTGLIEDSSKFTLQTSSLRPDTVDDVITKLNTAIEKGYDMAVLTHGFYETEEEALENYSCTEENYRQFLNAVKSYVDAGKAEVLTYSEYISKRKNNAVLRAKENQRIANWIFN